MSVLAILGTELMRLTKYYTCRRRGHVIDEASLNTLFSSPDMKLRVNCEQCKTPLMLKKTNDKFTITEIYELENQNS